MLLLQQMMALFLMMLIGYLCAKIGALDQTASKKISWLVVNVGNPAMIIASGMDNENPVEMKKIFLVIGLSLIIYAVLLLLSVFLPKILGVKRENDGVYRVMLIFSNIGFMGLPLLLAMYGGESLLYAAMFFFPFNILIYTYGIRAMQKRSDKKEKFQWKKVLNIGVISSFVALIIYFARIPMPDFVKTTVNSMSEITAPLSMMVIGASFMEFKIKELFTDVRLLLFSLIKLLLLPIAGTWLIMQFVTDPMICGVCMVMLATPVASMAAMLAQQYDGNYALAAKGVALTTILSVVTMPVVAAVLGL